MATLKQEFITFPDSVGRVIPGSTMEFYEADSLIQKNTYANKELTSTNDWPITSDGAGRFPVIFLASGGYRIIVKDNEGVQIYDRDDLNLSENTILTSSDFVFSTLVDAKQGVLISGDSISLQVGQAVTTLGNSTADDGEGAEWVVVAAGTGTPDDDLFANLDNGNQLQRLFNQLYNKNNLSDLPDKGDARTNLDVYSTAETDTAISDYSFPEGDYSILRGVALGGDFNTGEIDIVKIRDLVTITVSSATLTFFSTSTANSTTGVIPAGYRPERSLYDVVYSDGVASNGIIQQTRILTSGEFIVQFAPRDGSSSATQTDAQLFSISYIAAP